LNTLKSILTKALLLLFFFCSLSTIAQNDSITKERYTAHNKGKFTISWGGNREKYTQSDITFKGDNYFFMVEDAVAHDKPKGWHVDYVMPGSMTKPQTNFKMGYFLTDNYSISLGIDHMKYVMEQNQVAKISGEIDYPASHPSSQFNGIYNRTPVQLTENFLMFEHTDGLNYVYSEFARQDDISHLFGIKNTDKFQVNINEGVGLGVLYPKTNTTLMGQARHDEFHISGFGTSLKAGINLVLFKYFTIEGDLKGGYINMTDVRTTESSADSAQHSFFFVQTIIAFGGIFRI
jgi:hypothetical protein